MLFLDVDGTLLPLDRPDPSRLSSGLGERLLALNCELRWATGWGNRANVVLSPLLGLPQLPVVTLPPYPLGDYFPDGLHWKTRTLVRLAAGRPFIWVDNEIRDQDRIWVEDNHPGRALLHLIDSAAGVLDADFTALTEWLRTSR
ncbi:HAD domain-containing protein [Nocardia heshunensis]